MTNQLRGRGGRMAKRVAGVVAAGALATAGLVATAGPADAATTCGPPRLHNTVYGTLTVQNCPIWKANTPVFASPGSTRVVGYLEEAGNANWFHDQLPGPTYRAYGYASGWWAVTEADNGRWGYVPGVYFAGSSSSWTGLTVSRCTSGPCVP